MLMGNMKPYLRIKWEAKRQRQKKKKNLTFLVLKNMMSFSMTNLNKKIGKSLTKDHFKLYKIVFRCKENRVLCKW
jgi:hypothetical protein